MKFTSFSIIFLSLFLWSCQSDSGAGSGSLFSSKTKKVVSVDNQKVTFEDQSTFDFKEGESVIFLIPNAEHIKDSTKSIEAVTLIYEGTQRAESLVNIFKNADLTGTLSSTQLRSILTVNPLTKDKKIGTFNYSSDTRQRIFDLVFQYNPGGKYVMVGENNSIPLMIADLTGSEIGDNLPVDTHDKFYVISGSNPGSCSINEFRY